MILWLSRELRFAIFIFVAVVYTASVFQEQTFNQRFVDTVIAIGFFRLAIVAAVKTN